MQNQGLTVTPAILPAQSSGVSMSTGSAVAAAAVVAGVTMLAVGVAYEGHKFSKWMMEPYTFSNDELARHHILVQEYQNMGSEPLPQNFILTANNQPQFTMDYKRVKREIDNVIERISFCGASIQIARSSILSDLSKYLDSLSKRNNIVDKALSTYTRNDGVEAMFLSEMVSWWLKTVLCQPEFSAETTRAFGKKVIYCEHLLSRITRHDWKHTEQANFADFLKRFCKEMKDYHTELVNLSRMKNFNALIQEVSDHLSCLTSHTLNTFFLLINGAPQSKLNISQFKDPQSSDPKIKALLEKKLAKWLLKTLNIAGIEGITFEAMNILSAEIINAHLQGEHPDDEDCILEAELRNPVSSKWGHWDFVTKYNEKTPQTFSIKKTIGLEKEEKDPNLEPAQKSRRYLESIRELMRMVLRIIYLKQSLTRSKFVVDTYGQIWIYGSTRGKATLEELLFSIQTEVDLYNEKFKNFWSNYYNDFKAYAGANHKDARDPCYALLGEIESHNIRRSEVVEDLARLVGDIKAQANRLPRTTKEANQQLSGLCKELMDRMRHFYHRENEVNYRILSEAFEELQATTDQQNLIDVSSPMLKPVENRRGISSSELRQGLSRNTITENSIQLTILEYKKSDLPYYGQIMRIISDEYDSTYMMCNLLPETTNFRFSQMKNIYQRYIRAHHYEVTNPIMSFFSIYSKIPREKRIKFKEMYERVNTIFDLLYNNRLRRFHGLSSSPLDIEIIIAEQLIKANIEMDFRNQRYYNGFSLDVSGFLRISEKEGDSETIQITVDKKWLTVTKGLIIEKFNGMIKLISTQENKIKQLTKERNEAKEVVASQKEIIEEQKGEIASKDIIIEEQKGEITSKDIIIEEQKGEIEGQRGEISTKDTLIDFQQETLIEQTTVLAEMRIELEKLKATAGYTGNHGFFIKPHQQNPENRESTHTMPGMK